MPFRLRLTVIVILAAFSLAVYGTATYYSASLVAYVVEQAILQKLPGEADPHVVHQRLHDLLSSLPNHEAQLERLLAISQYVEKLQRLSSQELDEILRRDPIGSEPARN